MKQCKCFMSIDFINNFIRMLNPEENLIPSPSKLDNQQLINAYLQALTSLQATLFKSIENRHHSDHLIIQNFINLSPFFKELQQCFSQQFAKNIVKKGKVYAVKGKRCICEKGERMVRVFMPLYGRFYKRQEDKDSNQPQITIFQQLQQLIQNAHSIIPLRKKTTSMERRMTMLLENTQLRTTHANFKELTQLVSFSDEADPLILGFEEEQYAESLYSSGEVWLFAITPESLRSCIFQEYENRLIQKSSYFRKLECFNILDDGQLKAFVEKIPFIELKKDEYVFREGDLSQKLYLLIEGQAKAQKTVQLFKQDPNSLYRGVSKSQAGRRSQKPHQFSYADFQGVYNYSPQKKRMDLGILAPVTIFGDEEIAAGLPREADVQITSTKAKMFSFTLKDIESAGNGKKIAVDTFLNDLYDSITSKRIYVRRQGLSSNLQLENRRKMNYFFIDTSVQKTSHVRSRSAKEKINKSLSPAVTSRPHSSVKPRYHHFNFNEFVTPTKKTGVLKFSLQEQKIANLAHNSGEIQGKIEVSSRLSKERAIHRHKINIATPLFDGDYYKKQRKELLRIENKKRMRLIEVTGMTATKSRLRNTTSSMA